MDNLRLIVKDRAIDQYYHEGKTFVEGRKGTEYTIEYYNSSPRRVKVVLSVDGLNVISGDNDWKRGYVVEPWDTIKVPGWRKDNNNVAKFVFSSLRGSYNQHNDHGHAMNVGVIGAMVFNEVPQYQVWNTSPPWKPTYVSPGWTTCEARGMDASFGGTFHSVNCVGMAQNASMGQSSFTAGGMASGATAKASATASSDISDRSRSAKRSVNPCGPLCADDTEIKVGNVGTGWGANQHFATHEVSYTFEEHACQTLTIYYDDERGLRDRGINVRRPVRIDPNPFPKYSDGCPPPKYRY